MFTTDGQTDAEQHVLKTIIKAAKQVSSSRTPHNV